MTGDRDTTDPTAKWMRYGARALALIWALWWTLRVVNCWLVLFFADFTAVGLGYVIGNTGPLGRQITSFLVSAAGDGVWLMLLLVPWVSAAIPWRWEAIGG